MSESDDGTEKKMFAIVEFLDQQFIEYIPDSWLVGLTNAYWPNKKLCRIRKLITDFAEPDDAWPTYSIRVLGKAGDYIFIHLFMKWTKNFFQ